MYREKIREHYEHLSRSYRRVADYIMSNYYEVAFMTAAQLAYAVSVDTTTVVRFSQRLGTMGIQTCFTTSVSRSNLKFMRPTRPGR